MVLAEDRGGDHRKTFLASDRVRQLRDRGRSRFASEAARPRSFGPRSPSRSVLPSLQRAWAAAHYRTLVSAFDLGHGVAPGGTVNRDLPNQIF